MKKHALLLILAIMLCVAFSFLAQWYATKDYKNPYFGQPVFLEDQQILAVEFDSNINGHGHEVIPDSSLDEIVNGFDGSRLAGVWVIPPYSLPAPVLYRLPSLTPTAVNKQWP